MLTSNHNHLPQIITVRATMFWVTKVGATFASALIPCQVDLTKDPKFYDAIREDRVAEPRNRNLQSPSFS